MSDTLHTTTGIGRLLSEVAPLTEGRITRPSSWFALDFGNDTDWEVMDEPRYPGDRVFDEAVIVAFVQAECQRRDGWDMNLYIRSGEQPRAIVFRPATGAEQADTECPITVHSDSGVILRPFEASASSLAHAALTALRDAGQDTTEG